MTLRWISDRAAGERRADGDAVQRVEPPAQSARAASPRVSCPYSPPTFTPVRAMRCASSEPNSFVIDASWFGTRPFACIVTTRYDSTIDDLRLDRAVRQLVAQLTLGRRRARPCSRANVDRCSLHERAAGRRR